MRTVRTRSPYFSSKKASAAAQLERVALDADGADSLSILLVEEGVRARGDGLGHGLNHGRDPAILAHDPADLVLDASLLVGRQGAIERVVETKVVRRDERPGLVGLRPDDVAQGTGQQGRGRVVAHRPGPPLGVDSGGDRLPHLEPAVELAPMDEQPRDRLLCVFDREQGAAATGLEQLAVVADLPAALAVEGSGVEDHFGLALAGQLAVLDAVAQN